MPKFSLGVMFDFCSAKMLSSYKTVNHRSGQYYRGNTFQDSDNLSVCTNVILCVSYAVN